MPSIKNTPPIIIPAAFWSLLTDAEWNRVADTGQLDAELTKRLWRMLGRLDKPPPKRLAVMFDRGDLMREFPELGPKQ